MDKKIYINPPTNINDSWLTNDAIDASPHPNTIFRDAEIPPESNMSNRYTNFQLDFYKKIAIDIVTENTFDYPTPKLTEKSFRPIICKRLFIIVGPPYTLKMLHSIGIKTFHPFINENYDNIKDPSKRLLFIFDEITRLSNIPIHTYQNIIESFKSQLDNNYNILRNLNKIETEEIVRQIEKIKK